MSLYVLISPVLREAIHKENLICEWLDHLDESVSCYGIDGFDRSFESRPPFLIFSDVERIKMRSAVVERTLLELGITVDSEQLFSISQDAGRQLVRARAGSGKTRTLCARASLEIHDGSLNPDQVLVVAFNKSAADEVRKRMRNDFSCPDFENARTFHSLAYQLAKPKKKLLFDEGKHPSQRAQSGFVQST